MKQANSKKAGLVTKLINPIYPISQYIGQMENEGQKFPCYMECERNSPNHLSSMYYLFKKLFMSCTNLCQTGIGGDLYSSKTQICVIRKCSSTNKKLLCSHKMSDIFVASEQMFNLPLWIVWHSRILETHIKSLSFVPQVCEALGKFI